MPLQPTDDLTPDLTPDLTDEQQSTMDGVEHSIDEAKKAEADLRAKDPGALTQPQENPVPDAHDSES